MTGVAWVGLSVGMAFVGLVVLGVCAFKVFLGVQGLGRELERARRRLEPKQTALQNELRTLQDAQETGGTQDGVRSS